MLRPENVKPVTPIEIGDDALLTPARRPQENLPQVTNPVAGISDADAVVERISATNSAFAAAAEKDLTMYTLSTNVVPTPTTALSWALLMDVTPRPTIVSVMKIGYPLAKLLYSLLLAAFKKNLRPSVPAPPLPAVVVMPVTIPDPP